MLADKKISQSTAQYIMEETKMLVRAAVSDTIQKCSNILTENGQDGLGLLAGLSTQQANYDLFAGINNQKDQVRYFVNHFGMIVPEKIEIPDSTEAGSGPAFFYVVPIIKVIERLRLSSFTVISF